MASAWGIINNPKIVNFQEILSEEYAKDLQEKENCKYFAQVMLKTNDDITTKLDDNTHTNTTTSTGDDNNDSTKSPIGQHQEFQHAENEDQHQETLGNIAIKQQELLSDVNNQKNIQNHDDFQHALNSMDLNENCNSDNVIAEMLQLQFDLEHDEELKRMENHKNKNCKLSVSFKNFYRTPKGCSTNDLLAPVAAGETIDGGDDDDDGDRKHWDRFEENEKKFYGIPKKGFIYDEDGEMITKHDAKMCGVRNACRIMSFPPEVHTGDAAGFDMHLSNAVFNQLKRHSRRTKKSTKSNDRRENYSTTEMGLDKSTRLILYQFIQSKLLENVGGVISSGKEAIVLHGDTVLEIFDSQNRECAIKVFTTTLNIFKQRQQYIKDDYRFKDRFNKQNDRFVIRLWVEKEMHNLTKMKRFGINCPDVIAIKDNVLVMSFIGSNSIAAPKLKDAHLSECERICAYDEIVEMMVRLYNDANLVHADLSEYNVLWYDQKCWLIDVAQSVDREHPMAREFLLRDCKNICSFFTKYNVPNVVQPFELFQLITDTKSSEKNTTILSGLYSKGLTVHEANELDVNNGSDEFEMKSFPFDYAWNSTNGNARKNNTPLINTTAATTTIKQSTCKNDIENVCDSPIESISTLA